MSSAVCPKHWRLWATMSAFFCPAMEPSIPPAGRSNPRASCARSTCPASSRPYLSTRPPSPTRQSSSTCWTMTVMVQQVDDDWRVGEGGLVDRYGLVEAGHVERAHDTRGFERPAGGIDGSIAGQKNADIVAQSRQCFGQTADDIGDAALLGKGNGLSSDHQNVAVPVVCHAVLTFVQRMEVFAMLLMKVNGSMIQIDEGIDYVAELTSQSY